MYEKTDQPTLARSWNLSDDLGQIEYVFSDKTGTLTQNVMVFRHCTIGGKVYRGEDVHPTEAPQEGREDVSGTDIAEKEPVDVRLSPSPSASTGVASGSRLNGADNDDEKRTSGDNQMPDPAKVFEDMRSIETIPVPEQGAIADDSTPSIESVESEHRFHSAALEADMSEAIHADMHSENAFHARTLNGFLDRTCSVPHRVGSASARPTWQD